MATKSRTVREPARKEEETAAPAPQAAASDVDTDSISVVNGERYIRTYSREVHGDNFMDLAKEFCSKKARMGVYTMVEPHLIKKLEVRYREKADGELPLDKQKPDSPMEDKVRVFEDKEEAVRFGSSKFAASVVISQKK